MVQSYTSSGLSWVQTVGCVLLIYGFLLSNKRRLWIILLVHGITGFFGTFFENLFSALHAHNYHMAWILGMNELFWFVNECTTVLYVYYKLEVVISSKTTKRILLCTLAVIGLVFGCLRANIGVQRIKEDKIGSHNIRMAHSYAFLAWGAANLILANVIGYSVLILIRSAEKTKSIIFILLKSSMPILFTLVVNTLLIVIISQIHLPKSNAAAHTNAVLWAIKGAYPILLFFDISSSAAMLIQEIEEMHPEHKQIGV